MIDPKTIKIRKAIHQWCKEDIPSGMKNVPDRTERIIQKAMTTFKISKEEAKHNFLHNNDLSD